MSKFVEKVESSPGCIQSTLLILGDKWTPLMLSQLVESPKTFSELETSLINISPRTLSQRLDKLNEAGIIGKESYCSRPPRYHYYLTPKGTELEVILSAMADWGTKHSQAKTS